MKNGIWQSTGLDLVNINVYAKFHQNIPYGSTDNASFIFFQNCDLGKASTDDKWHLFIPWAKFCQTNVYAKSHQKVGQELLDNFHKLLADGRATSQTDRGRIHKPMMGR